MATPLQTESEVRARNQELFDKIMSNDRDRFKEAADESGDFVRLKLRERAFLPHLITPKRLTNADLDRVVSTVMPVKVDSMEVDAPAAVSVPFASTPQQFWIRQRRFETRMDRILTPAMVVDVDELRTCDYDIRQVFSDNITKDADYELDRKWMAAVDAALVSAGATLPASGVAQYKTYSGGWIRTNLVESLKILPSTRFHLDAVTGLVNNITWLDNMKFDMIEAGGEWSSQLFKSGVSSLTDLAGRRWIVTIKTGLVPDNHVYYQADERFVGKYYELEPLTMHMKREGFMLEFNGWMLCGATLAHTGAVAHANLNA
jgi:hypothetical protein